MRTAPAVRLALCAAALLAVFASFGLHPEPGESLGRTPAAFAKSAGPQSVHGCVACLNHGIALTSPLAGLFAAGVLLQGDSPLTDPLWRGRLAGTDLPGRSPPFDRS